MAVPKTAALATAPAHAPPAGTSLGELIEEFRALELQRRQGGLPLAEAERYYALFNRLDEALASGERHRKADQRQFLRVPTDLVLLLRTPSGLVEVKCTDFGGGGCFFYGSTLTRPGDTVWLDGARLEGQLYPLHGRALVAWVDSAAGRPDGQGIRFVLECTEFRDQIDRLFYRILDAVLGGASAAARRSRPKQTTDDGPSLEA